MKIDSLVLLAAILMSAGVWLILSRQWLRTIMGVSLLGHAVNIYLLKSGARVDILPQALILTAIVIGLGLQTVLLALAFFAHRKENVSDLDRLREDV